MPKHQKKRSSQVATPKSAVTKPAQLVLGGPEGKSGTPSKQAVIIDMLRAPTGTTIAAMMQSTGWQQHSVRGFLAGVVRKKLKLKLTSAKIDGNRIYRISNGTRSKADGSRSKQRAA